jgi:hypothetical protein
MSSSAAQKRARYYRLQAQGRCVKCACRLPKGHVSVRCNPCLDDLAAYNREKRAEERQERKEVEAAPDVARCAVCLLAEPHVCLSRITGAERPGPGRTYPST